MTGDYKLSDLLAKLKDKKGIVKVYRRAWWQKKQRHSHYRLSKYLEYEFEKSTDPKPMMLGGINYTQVSNFVIPKDEAANDWTWSRSTR